MYIWPADIASPEELKKIQKLAVLHAHMASRRFLQKKIE